MTFLAISPRRRASWVLAATAALWVSLTIGCASPGLPRPPSLHLPEPVNNLTAERIGGAVELRWTTPLRTTDGLAVTGPLTAELCRSEPSPASAATRCAVVQRIAVVPGASHATDVLPPSLDRDPAALLAYRVQIFNGHGHSAGLSPEAFAASGAAPPPVERLRATLTRSGTRLEWQPTPEAFLVELDRIPVPSSAQPAAQPGANPVARPTTKPAGKQPFHLAAVSQPEEVRLTVANRPSDLGGTIDGTALPTAEQGQTYRYTAQRVRMVQIANHALELRSLPSPAVLVSMHDIFPPAPPTGLAAIPGGAGTSGPSINLSIDLSWRPVPDPDVAGYAVYRQQVSPAGALLGQPQRLTQTPVAGPAFRDRTVLPGQRYVYTVTAIDTAGNESAPSASVRETAKQP